MAKIILTQEVSGLGAAGDVVTVKDGTHVTTCCPAASP